MDLDTLFGKARKLANKSSNKKPRDAFLTELDEFEQFMEDNAYDVDALTNESSQIRDGYLSSHKNSKQAINVFNKITSIINPQSNRNHHHYHHHNQQSSLIRKKLHNKFDHFTNLIDFKNLKNRNAFITVDKYIPNGYRFLKQLEKVSVKNGIPLSEYLVTGYHQSGLPINEYIAQNGLFNQLKTNYDLSPSNRHINIAHQSMTNYLIEYEKVVCKPIHNLISLQHPYALYNDDITIIMNYIIEINLGINKILSKQTSYPVQLDVFFVAPQMYSQLNLHSLDGLDKIKSDRDSRKNGAMDAIADIYHLLRRAANSINQSNGQRFIMLIVRDKKADTSCDTVYIYKSGDTKIAPGFVSDNVELNYLLNSKCGSIMNGLSSTDEGILGLTHHLHSPDCNKVYLSYGNYKSRVFKQDILSLLPILFEPQNNGRHIIGHSKRTDFINSYREFKDFGYAQVGQYWFNNNVAYECFEPYWNPQNCRAMGNVFIPKKNPSCTEDLNKYIDESFESAEKLYYKMDYTIGMQIVDKQTIYIKLNDNTSICLINTELHRNGQLLYAVIVENTFKSKQRWKIIDYNDISQAFMTASQLVDKYGIFIIDLPKGSKAKHNHFMELTNKINVTKVLIRSTNWSHIRIVQSKQNLGKLGLSSSSFSSSHSYHHNSNNKSNKSNNGNGIGVLAISERRFKQLALKSLREYREKGMALTPIAHFKFRKNQYHLEKLLPVYIPERGKYVAISFWYNELAERGRTQASGVCLDLTDMKNKANLVQQVPRDSWLNVAHDDMTVNNLTIQHDTPATKKINTHHHNHHNHNHNPNRNDKKKKTQKTMAPKVTPMSPCTQAIHPPLTPVVRAQPNHNLQNMQNMQNIQHLMQNNMFLQSAPVSSISSTVPQLIASSSIGSVASIPSMQSMQSMPMQSTPCMIQQSSVPSYPNIQQLQQNAQYFANFLPSNFNVVNTVTTSPNAVNCFYNNNNNANYSMQYNQQYNPPQYTMRYN